MTDANDGKPVAGHRGAGSAERDGGPHGQDQPAGRYRLQLPVGCYVIAAGVGNLRAPGAPGHGGRGQTVTANFSLKTARAEVKPSTVELVVKADQVRKRTLTLKNTGSLPLDFQIAESGGSRQSVVSTASLARRENRDPSACDTRGLFEPGIRAVAGWTPSAPGNVLRSFTPTGMQLAWGVGYTGPVWLSDASTNKNQEFTAEGTAHRAQLGHALGRRLGAADMAYDAKRGRVCQLGVGMTPEQNGIHCWDPATGQVTDTITGLPLDRDLAASASPTATTTTASTSAAGTRASSTTSRACPTPTRAR